MPTAHRSTLEPEIDPRFAAALEQAKLEALYQFAYGLSHEINNPLANIATRAQTLLIDERDPARRQKLAVINQQAFRAHEMIADLMLFARPPAIQRENVDLVQLAGRVVAELQPAAQEQRTALVLTGESAPLMAAADPTHLAVALRALIQNSLEALKSGGRVEVNAECGVRSAECQDDSVLSTQYSVPSTQVVPAPHFNPKSQIPNLKFTLTVVDSGPGIPTEIRPHIFDPFYSGREAGRGLGLGLSKAWRIVQLHGGEITVESPASGGARFTIALPG